MTMRWDSAPRPLGWAELRRMVRAGWRELCSVPAGLRSKGKA